MVEAGRCRHDRREFDSPVAFHGCSMPAAHAEDECLRRAYDRKHFVDPQHPEIGKRHRAALIVFEDELPVARLSGKNLAFIRDG